MKSEITEMMSLRWIARGLILTACLFANGAWADEIPTPFAYRVLGWSDDSARWGFQEQGDYGAGMVFSPGGGVYVIDAVANRFVFKHFLSTGDSASERGDSWARRTADATARRDLGTARSLGLRGAPGTIVYERPKMVWLDYDSELKQFGDKRVTFDHAGHTYTVMLQDAFMPDQGSLTGTKSKLSVSIRRDDNAWQILQADSTYWRPYMAYRVVHVSISPDDQKVGILIEAVENGLEGQKQAHYKGVTGLLP
jgi:hypothetical protein